jgi:hypothetical protein
VQDEAAQVGQRPGALFDVDADLTPVGDGQQHQVAGV